MHTGLRLLLLSSIGGQFMSWLANGEEVLVKEVNTVLLPGDTLPRVIVVHVLLTPLLALQLVRNTLVSMNVPVMFADNDTLLPEASNDEMVAFYQDSSHKAVISVRQETHCRWLEGSFEMSSSLVTHMTRRFIIYPKPGLHCVANMSSHGLTHVVELISSEMLMEESNAGSKGVTGETYSQHVTGVASSHRELYRRGKSQVDTYHVEVLLLLDHTVWQQWSSISSSSGEALNKLKFYFASQMNGIDYAFSSIDSARFSVRIKPWLKGYYIAKTPAQSVWTVPAVTRTSLTYSDTAIDGDKVLALLSSWAHSQPLAQAADLVMAVTRFNLFGDSTIGYAIVGGVCDKRNKVSISEDLGFMSWMTLAHEMAHNACVVCSLGAWHDGERNECVSPHIMSAVARRLSSSVLNTAFTFSKCSVMSMHSLLRGSTDGRPRNCVRSMSCTLLEPRDTHAPLPGQVYDVQHQCSLYHGALSTACSSVSDICLQLWCRYSVSGEPASCHQSQAAADGTRCSADGLKWCVRGRCQAKTISVTMGYNDCLYSLTATKTTIKPLSTLMPAIAGAQWSQWSQCSLSCGSGVRYRSRPCDSVWTEGRCEGIGWQQETCQITQCPPLSSYDYHSLYYNYDDYYDFYSY